MVTNLFFSAKRKFDGGFWNLHWDWRRDEMGWNPNYEYCNVDESTSALN
jgi:hypothetical protein